MRQSLWLSPQGGSSSNNRDNSAWGYYADGFFDRRKIENSSITSLSSVVSALNDSIAYVGNLFYNSKNNASLFFPASGLRFGAEGNAFLTETGDKGNYWSSSIQTYTASSIPTGWNLHISKNAVYQSFASTPAGFNVRCVSCAYITSLSLSASSSSAAIGSPVTLTAAITSIGGDIADLRYKWELLHRGDWYELGLTTTNTFSHQILFTGANNQYRVTVLNGCNFTSDQTSVNGTLPTQPEPDPNILSYVGAFWRAGQTGERLIRIEVGNGNLGNYGPWTAAVSWLDANWNTVAGDGVVLSKAKSPDIANLYTNNPFPVGANHLNYAENFQVYHGSDSTMISGTAAAGGYIEFRIGLKTTYASGNTSPRYAMVLLTYGNGKWRRIFIRQGEGADYVMRPEDAVNSGGMNGTRNLAMKFAAYNIKDPQHRIPTHRNDAIFPPSVFVDYPTMIGYLFSYNSPNGSSKFGAAPVPNGPTIGGWTINQMGIQGWWANGHETCPSGYRRPGDGPTNSAGSGSVAASEIRQSLFLNPLQGNSTSTVNANSVGGMYADGYYDRGDITRTNGANNTVIYNYRATPTPSNLSVFVAASGRLYYNPATCASVFLPASGESNSTNGIIGNLGYEGTYWTRTSYGSSTSSKASVLFFNIDENANGGSSMQEKTGEILSAIRCVQN